ncbi:conserved hypothetical protein [Cupriavidus taiwanensis]|nr:conserved hypothetical protein [Cupriavidus taiwanensis]SOZ40564.1 conserved hypothetical protein [Cupriavidus neocaledonicus]SOY75723.1 conserved hypothetical protein [Cupriavidus taiwanensis]SOY75793.1 conserved hypothetical protein [Cupriavidus taiwanensis]SOY76201.1 conserved hypothetical protein [Cupriavidus taiwanensis]
MWRWRPSATSGSGPANLHWVCRYCQDRRHLFDNPHRTAALRHNPFAVMAGFSEIPA